jgi:hypothetical protein
LNSRNFPILFKTQSNQLLVSISKRRSRQASCRNFAEEKATLQHIGKEHGVTVIILSNFHAELAEDGIEFKGANEQRRSSNIDCVKLTFQDKHELRFVLTGVRR